MAYQTDSDSAAASAAFAANAGDPEARARRRLPRVWSERTWAVSLLFAGLLIGTWAVILAGDVGHLADGVRWLRVATTAVLAGLLPVVALLVLSFAWRHRSVAAALAAAESRLSDMVEASSDWLWEMGPDLRFTLVGDRIPGLEADAVAALRGKTWAEAINTSYDEEGWARLAADLAARRPFRDFVYLDKTTGGELRWRKISGRPFFDAKGRFRGYRGTGADVTQQKQAELSLRKAHKDLQESEDRFRSLVADMKRTEAELIEAKSRAESVSRAKTEFLAQMSHELRTPLNAIIGFSDLVRSEVYGPLGNTLYKEYLQDVMTSANHLLALINDILDLSKAEAGMISLHEEPASPADIARECVAMLRQQAEGAGLELTCRVAADLPALVCDERKVKQMLLNLLSNAIKFTPSGGRVMLEAGLGPAGLRFAVRDTGVGIAAADLATALAVFGRVDGEIGRNRPGTGLGLPLTKLLAEAHGAEFAIDSDVGVGTTVTIVFPRSRLLSRAA